MPKVKTHSRAKKTLKFPQPEKSCTGSQLVGHLLTKKSTKRKRALRIEGEVHSSNAYFVKRLLRMK